MKLHWEVQRQPKYRTQESLLNLGGTMSVLMNPAQVSDEANTIPWQDMREQVEDLLRELLNPQNRPALEQFRFRGSTNRVYRIPLTASSSEPFIVVKLLPSPWVELRNRSKRILRNLLYGEHDVSTGGKRVQLEIERALEWQREGLPVPPLIETSIPGVRAFLGLPYPTLYTILSDNDVEPECKLQVLQAVVQALSLQHQLARERGKKSLVHRDPGPWNIMFDLTKGDTYWYDLEHPAEYPKMSLEALMVRAIRIFLFGVLEHLEDHHDEVIKLLVDHYEPKQVLWEFVRRMDHCKSPRLRHLLQRMWWRRSFRSRRLIGEKVRLYLKSRVPET